MNKLIKIVCAALLLTMTLGIPISTSANENDSTLMAYDLNSMDFSKSFTITESFIDDEGETVTVKLSYEPNNDSEFGPYGEKTNPAHEGTWTSEVNYGVLKMSYKFDLEKSGSQWKISNGREHVVSGVFVTVNDKRLNISRATSTNTFPAEINAEADVTIFDNAWVPIYSNTWVMATTVDSNGLMKLTWQ